MAIDARVQQRVAFEFSKVCLRVRGLIIFLAQAFIVHSFAQGHDLIAFERQRAVERRSSLRRAADARVQARDKNLRDAMFDTRCRN